LVLSILSRGFGCGGSVNLLSMSISLSKGKKGSNRGSPPSSRSPGGGGEAGTVILQLEWV
jgi:hypothetical protein